MLYIPKIDDYLEMLTDAEVKDLVVKNLSKPLNKEQNLGKVTKSLYNLLTTPDEVQSNSSDNCIHHYNVRILNLFDPELQLINNKPVIKKALLNDLKKFQV